MSVGSKFEKQGYGNIYKKSEMKVFLCFNTVSFLEENGKGL